MGTKSSVNEKPCKADIQKFIEQIKPLDLLVFKGGDLTSHAIMEGEEYITGSSNTPSHVEIMITKEWCDRIKCHEEHPIYADQPLSWGSTSLGKSISIETGGHVNGVQIRDLEYLMTKYLSKEGSNVGYCSLRNNPTVFYLDNEKWTDYAARSDKLKRDLCAAYDKYHGKEYNNNPLALIGVMFPQFRHLRNASQMSISSFEKGNKLFCSEFVASLYEDIGIIDDMTDGVADGKMLDPRDVLPVDFFGPDADNQFVNSICKEPVWFR